MAHILPFCIAMELPCGDSPRGRDEPYGLLPGPRGLQSVGGKVRGQNDTPPVNNHVPSLCHQASTHARIFGQGEVECRTPISCLFGAKVHFL